MRMCLNPIPVVLESPKVHDQNDPIQESNEMSIGIQPKGNYAKIG